jgi:hypothetical protein
LTFLNSAYEDFFAAFFVWPGCLGLKTEAFLAGAFFAVFLAADFLAAFFAVAITFSLAEFRVSPFDWAVAAETVVVVVVVVAVATMSF